MTTHPKRFSPERLHTEEVVERHIVDQLVTTQGYEERPPEAFDKTLGLDREVVVAFIKDTQPDVWRTLEGQYPGAAEDEFFRNLEVALKGRGTLEVLREGFKIVPNMHFRLMFPRPASSLNPDLVRAWQGNRLTVMTQVVYGRRTLTCSPLPSRRSATGIVFWFHAAFRRSSSCIIVLTAAGEDLTPRNSCIQADVGSCQRQSVGMRPS